MTTFTTAARREEDESHESQRAATTPRAEARLVNRARRLGVILVVDDTADTRDLYSTYFESVGFTVITAADGDEGIAAAAGQRPDVIIMDLSMPRMDGITAIRRLKEDPSSAGIPIILFTGYPVRALRDGALDAGATLIQTKPCLPEDVELLVRGLLDGRLPK